ncbi:MAG: GNAT family N-acetyltransferase [Candidatus Eremiobacteraeota bacterium]|nr:GNAT family N-acetyltransferase [Candidatus Eremiobacteraeota bacterium]
MSPLQIPTGGQDGGDSARERKRDGMGPDHKRLSKWLTGRDSFAECLHPALLESCRVQKLALIDRVVCLEQDSAFFAWSTGFREEDTGQPVTALWGWEGGTDEKAALLKRSLDELEGHLMVELATGDSDAQLLADHGFVLERHRLSLNPQEHILDTPRQGRYSLRLATELDRVMLCTLAADYAQYTVPPGREELLQQYTASILGRFRAVDFGPDSAVDLFVAEENYQSVGYILVELMPDGTVYLEDIGVKRAHWGKYVAQFMVRAVENLLVQYGVELLWCEISAANRRSYLTAVRSLRFQPRVEIWLHRRHENLSSL